MTPQDFFILAAIGLAAGILSGLFGVGGGLIMVPAMVFFLGMSQHAAQGTSLAVLVMPVALVAAYTYHQQGQLNFKYALVIAAVFVVGSFLGAKLSLGLNETLLKRIFGLLMLIMSIKLIFFSKPAA